MAGKGRPFKKLKNGKVIFGKDLNGVHDFLNAIINGEIVNGKANELLIGDLKIIWKVKSDSGTSVSGWQWASPIEVDSGQSYAKGEVIHIQEVDTLVTGGIRDAANPTGPVVMSRAGLWVATQDVPPASLVSGNFVWNLPQFPYPNPDAIDDTLNFWYWISDEAKCY